MQRNNQKKSENHSLRKSERLHSKEQDHELTEDPD
jgi:hypothetical protein